MILDDTGIPFNYVHSCSAITAGLTMHAYLSIDPVNITGKGAKQNSASGACLSLHVSVSVYCDDPETFL